MKYMIDTPSPFATIQEWEQYLRDLFTLAPMTDEIKQLISQAQQTIAEKKRA